ncbi:MAG: hypothetical protein MJ088_03300 [Clostridia bacterium]|nr:hypothetical protein [Clostridia bacterium]
MSSIAANLTALQNAKEAIAAAITDKGGTLATGDGFADFALAILAIPTSSGGSGGSGGSLPTLSTPASADDILSGKEAISGDGSVITGSLKFRHGTATLSNNLSGMTTQTITHNLGVTPKIVFVSRASTENVASGVLWAMYFSAMGGYTRAGTVYAVSDGSMTQSVLTSGGNRIALSSNANSFGLAMTDNSYNWKNGETVNWWVLG